MPLGQLTRLSRRFLCLAAPKLDNRSLDLPWVALLHGADLLRDIDALGDQLKARDVHGLVVADPERLHGAAFFRNRRHELQGPEKIFLAMHEHFCLLTRYFRLGYV